MNATDTVLSARALLENLTPLKTDCGRLCAADGISGDEGEVRDLIRNEIKG